MAPETNMRTASQAEVVSEGLRIILTKAGSWSALLDTDTIELSDLPIGLRMFPAAIPSYASARKWSEGRLERLHAELSG